MAHDQKMFLHVPLNTREQNPCSPLSPGPTWRGVLIRAPIHAKFKSGFTAGERHSFAAIPLCGYYLVDLERLRPGVPLRIVAVDQLTQERFEGDVIDKEENLEEPPPEIPAHSASNLEGIAVGSWFNPNLPDYVSLPAVAATYAVHVEYGSYRSNIVEIQVSAE